MRAVTTIPVLLIIASAVWAQSGEIPVADTCPDQFRQRLKKCEPFECRMPYPAVPGSLVTMRILGRDGDLCHTTKTLPPALLEDCKYSKGSIAYLTSEEGQDATGGPKSAKGDTGGAGTPSNGEVRPGFALRECRKLVDEETIKAFGPADQAEIRNSVELLEEERQEVLARGVKRATPTKH